MPFQGEEFMRRGTRCLYKPNIYCCAKNLSFLDKSMLNFGLCQGEKNYNIFEIVSVVHITSRSYHLTRCQKGGIMLAFLKVYFDLRLGGAQAACFVVSAQNTVEMEKSRSERSPDGVKCPRVIEQ